MIRSLLVVALLMTFAGSAGAGGSEFRRGDTNADGQIDISDAIQVLLYLIGEASLICEDAADTNDNGIINVGDPVYLLGTLFAGTDDPPAPYPGCGTDPTADDLDCAIFPGCP